MLSTTAQQFVQDTLALGFFTHHEVNLSQGHAK